MLWPQLDLFHELWFTRLCRCVLASWSGVCVCACYVCKDAQCTLVEHEQLPEVGACHVWHNLTTSEPEKSRTLLAKVIVSPGYWLHSCFCLQLFACPVAKLYIAELAARSANHCRNAWQASHVVHAQFFPLQMTAKRSAMQSVGLVQQQVG